MPDKRATSSSPPRRRPPGSQQQAAVAVAGQAARAQALLWLQAILTKHQTFETAQFACDPALEGRDRALAQHLTLTTLRRLGQIDEILHRCLKNPQKLAGVAFDLLRLAVTQLLFLKTPVHAVQATMLALAATHRCGGLKSVLSGVVHRLAREGDSLLAATDAVGDNLPSWLWQSWVNAYGHETAQKIAHAILMEPPLDITVKADPAQWAQKLGGILLPTGTVRLPETQTITTLAGFADGAWWVQDAAAALPVKILGDVRGKKVLDLCAAPGGKTAQLLVRGATVTAVDSDGNRLLRLRENLSRLGLTATVIEADVLHWQPEAPADIVLLDAPCTATGTMRRHPDLAQRKRAADVAQCAARQTDLLQRAAQFVQPGGLLLYAVCSLQPEECERQIATFLAKHKSWRRLPIKPTEVYHQQDLITPLGDLRCLPSHWPEHGGMDGFYVARLQAPI